MLGLRFGPLGASAVHLCVDMQRLFTSDGPWPVPWMERVLPVVVHMTAVHPAQTVFTRFVPPRSPEHLPGRWRAYYERWRHVTLDELDTQLVDVLPQLGAFRPPAEVVDKHGYSAFTAPALLPLLRDRRVDTLVVTGSETDVCVLASILAAVDYGYRVVVVEDGICSSSDASHDRILATLSERLAHQVEVASVDEILAVWG